MKIICKNISKSFSGKRVLEGITFESKESCVAILGANSAGKTTLLKIFATILKPDFGDIKIDQIDIVKEPKKIRRILSFVPENPFLLRELSAIDNIKHFSYLKKVKVNPKQVIEQFCIPFTNNPVRTLSKGIQQRLMVAIALMSNPRLLILDEPTNSIDRESKEVLWKLLVQMKEEGKIVLLSTHDEEEVLALADYVIILDQGRVLFSGHVKELPVGKFYVVQIQDQLLLGSHTLSDSNGKASLLVEYEELPKLISQHKVLGIKNIGLKELLDLKNKQLS